MNLRADVRYSFRLLRKTPVFTLAAMGILALGIGANTTIFSLLHSVLLRPLPYGDPDRLVMVWEDNTAAGFPRNTPAPGNYNDWRQLNRSFTDMAATRGGATAALTGDGPPEQVLGRAVSANFFTVLGVSPQVGRGFLPGEDGAAAGVVVIADSLWRRRYAADPRIVGRTIVMNDARVEVVGVAPRSFVFRDRDVEYWVPMFLPPAQAATRNSHFLNVVARLKDGVSVAAADADIKAITARLAQQYPNSNRGVAAAVVPMQEELLGDTRIEVLVLMVAAASILLIACANLASLLLARAVARKGDYAVRLSLGATRAQLARQVLTEGLMLSVGGGALGLVLPVAARTLMERLVPVTLLPPGAIVDWRLLLFAASVSLATGLIFSLGPALQIARGSTADALQQTSRGSVGASSRRFRDGLVVLQVAATLVLLVTAGLMLRTLANLNAVALGFDASGVLTMRVPLPQPKYADAGRRQAFFDRVVAGVRAVPGVENAAFGSTLPFESIGNTRGFDVEGREEEAGEIRDALFRVGTAAYLQTLGVRPVEGRLIDERDVASAPRAIVINETFARRYWPGEPAVGHRVRFGRDEPWFTIVGVVANVLERGYGQNAKPGVYVASAQVDGGPPSLIVRVTGDPERYASALQRVIRSVDPDQPVRLVRTLESIVGASVADRRQQTILLAGFGALALLIAAIGLYGLLAQSVLARSREIGLRIALGASWRDVIAMVMTHGIVLTAAGTVTGVAVALAATRAMRALLYEVGAADPFTFALGIGLLGVVAGIACAVPALRAARTDPTVMLREA